MLGFFKGKSKDNIIYSPCKGKVVPITEVSDPTFSEKVLGDGFAVIPSEGKIYAPADGEISMVFDTVTLKGEPFISHVSGGQQVKKGDLLLEADLEKIKSAGLDTITPVLICNTDDYNKINLIKEGEVSIDDEVLKIS